MIKVFTKDSNGKISFTENELKKLLDEAYWEGYNDNRHSTYTYRSPYSPWSWTTTATSVTLNSTADTATNTTRRESLTIGDTYVGSATVTCK